MKREGGCWRCRQETNYAGYDMEKSLKVVDKGETQSALHSVDHSGCHRECRLKGHKTRGKSSLRK